ncbi:MAG: SIR2 family protein [Promethearchaeota archaeon]
MSENEEIKPSEIIFFFGAGISVPAGVPTTFRFVKEFEEYLIERDKELYSKFEEIKDLIRKSDVMGKKRGEEPDIEMIYEFLNRLYNHKNELVLIICENYEREIKRFNKKNIRKLIDELKMFIKSKTYVEIDKTHYLNGLRKFFGSNIINEVYTTNYDNIIEQFCFHNNIDYSDGFELFWDLKNFEKKNIQLRIYKIHGSLGWYQTSSGRFIKIPLLLESNLNSNNKFVLHTGEEISDMIMYPMQKWERPGPLLDLIYLLKQRLNSLNTKIVISAGYSFRDEYIRLLFIEALKSNKDLQLIIITPSAEKTKRRLLKEVDKDLRDRVVIYPAYYEHILSYLHELSSYLKRAVEIEKKCLEDEIKGYTKDWKTALYYYEKSLHFDKIFDLIDRKIRLIKDLAYEDFLKTLFITTIGLIAIESKNKANSALVVLQRLILKIIEFTKIEISKDSKNSHRIFYRAEYKYYDNESERTYKLNNTNMQDLIKEMKKLDFLEILAKKRIKEEKKKWSGVLDLFNLARSINEYLTFWDYKPRKINQIAERHKKYKKLLGIELKILDLNDFELKKKIKKNEKIILEKIIEKSFKNFNLIKEKEILSFEHWQINRYQKY